MLRGVVTFPRWLLLLLIWLLALGRPEPLRASIPHFGSLPPVLPVLRIAPVGEDDGGTLTLHLDGLHDRAGPCRRVLVRQNPWSKFDPEGLEPNKPKYTLDEAFVESAKEISRIKPTEDRDSPDRVEYRSDIYKDPTSGKYLYTDPYGIQDPKTTGSRDLKRAPSGMDYNGLQHNHPGTDASGPEFSYRGYAATGGTGDKGVADEDGKPIGVTQSDGKGNWNIKKYTPLPGSKNAPEKAQKGTVTEYDQETKSFVAEKPRKPPVPQGAEPSLVGIKDGSFIYEYKNGKQEAVKPGQSDAFLDQFKKTK